ncbi:MAG: inositol monophosphatase [Candidatus Aenigmarchaeota archaeon]|nr:inositol monophosphatase [Candidatus Aenigmarchaeota archaeon]
MYEYELNIAINAAKAAGKIIQESYGLVLEEKEKENWQELVTQIDLEADCEICTILEEEFPDHTIKSEESMHKSGKSEFTWYIDPLDGTTNYVTQIPFFCTAIGLMKGNEPLVGVVFSPITSEIFTAAKGKGAFLNGKKIHVSKNDDIRKTLINFCHKNNPEEIEKIGKAWVQLKQMGRDLRRLGSGNLDIAFVACGRNDAYLSSSKIFDIAPALVIAKEAGCKITDWKNMPWTAASEGILITNGTRIHDQLIEVLSKL